MKRIFLLFVLVFTTASAFASNFYIDAFGGINFVHNIEENGDHLDFNTGYALGGSLGYRFSQYLRVEVEGAYRSNTADQMVIQNVQIPLSGSIQKATLMANGLVNIPFTQNLSAYIGAGAGERWDREVFTVDPLTTADGVTFFPTFKSESQGFVCQGIAGIVFCTNQQMQLAAEYRYLDGPSLQANHTLGLNLKRFF